MKFFNFFYFSLGLILVLFIVVSIPSVAKAEDVEYTCSCILIKDGKPYEGPKSSVFASSKQSSVDQCKEICQTDPNYFAVSTLPKTEFDALRASGDELRAGTGKSSADLLSDAANRLNPAAITEPAQLIGRFIKILLAFIGSISLVLYIVAGFLWMTASGNAEQVTKAKSIMVWTTLGVVVMLSSYMLASFIFKSLGL
ncbi:MAG: hypothetical protein AAB797_01670 [Patescibacteria group bacterium]